MKLLPGWGLDPHAPGFREEALRQAALLRNAPEEHEALDFILELCPKYREPDVHFRRTAEIQFD